MMHTGVKQVVVVTSTIIVFVSAAGMTAAQQAPARPAAPIPAGPAPPTLPDTIARDDQGRATILAVRVDTPLRVDG
jgi:hypothetical protein